MRKLLVFAVLLLSLPACAQSNPLGNPLKGAMAEGVKSMAWKIKTEGVTICCCDDSQSWSTSDSHRNEYTTIIALAQIEGGRITKLRVKEPNCPVKADRFVDVTNDQSLDFLLGQVHTADREGNFLAVVSMHDHPRVVPELIQLARKDRSEDVRKHALFWLGQKAGEKAADELQRAIDEDPDDDVRQHAVFAVSQLPKERAVPILVKLVKTHKSREVRKRAMFWLTQTNDPRALALIEDILKP